MWKFKRKGKDWIVVIWPWDRYHASKNPVRESNKKGKGAKNETVSGK